MTFRRLLSSGTLALHALAGSANADIYTRETLPTKPENFERAYDSTFKLEKMNEGGLCTAFATSPDGYVLTNLHCIVSCLADKDLISRTYFNPLMGREVKLGIIDVETDTNYSVKQVQSVVDGSIVDVVYQDLRYRIRRVREQAPQNLVCENFLLGFGNAHDGAWYKGVQFLPSARVVYLGSSSSTFADEHVSSFTTKTIQALRDSNYDYAVLKFDLPGPVTCAPVSRTEAKYGDDVWVVGYPMHALRDSGLDSPGSRKAVSFGRVRGSIAEDPYLRNLVDNPDSLTGEPLPRLNLTAADWQRLGVIYDNPYTLLTNLDGLPGSSGSPILNKSGEVVAVLHSGVAYSSKIHLGATVLGLRMSYILNDIRNNLGEATVSEIFSCQD